MGVAAADLDGDGIEEIATSNASGFDDTYGISVLRGLGKGEYTSKIDFMFPPSVAVPERVYLRDLDFKESE